MNKWKLFRMFVFILMIVVLFYFSIYSHEEVHRQIYRSFECTNITVSIGFFSGITHATCLNNDSYNYVRLAHGINEVVGYTIMPWVILLVVGMLSSFYRRFEKDLDLCNNSKEENNLPKELPKMEEIKNGNAGFFNKESRTGSSESGASEEEFRRQA